MGGAMRDFITTSKPCQLSPSLTSSPRRSNSNHIKSLNRTTKQNLPSLASLASFSILSNAMSTELSMLSNRDAQIPGKDKSLAEINETQRRQEAAIDKL